MNARLRELIDARQIYDAWLLLHGAHAAAVYRFVLERTSARTADDRCRDVWNAVYQGLPRYDVGVSPRSWLFALARMLCDRSPTPPPISLGRALFLARGLGLRVRRSDVSAIEHSIAALPPDDRELLELRYVSGLRASELARILGANVRSIEQRLTSILIGVRVVVGAMATDASRRDAAHVRIARERRPLVQSDRPRRRPRVQRDPMR